jgi:hypothetical protein
MVLDAPDGRQSKIRGDIGTLVRDALAEAGRVAAGSTPASRPTRRTSTTCCTGDSMTVIVDTGVLYADHDRDATRHAN